jgi:hypothetical protein
MLPMMTCQGTLVMAISNACDGYLLDSCSVIHGKEKKFYEIVGIVLVS